MKYASIGLVNNVETVVFTAPLSMFPNFDPKNPPPNACAVGEDVEVGWVKRYIGERPEDGPWPFEFTPPPPPTQDELVKRYSAAVQRRLDDFAKTKGYDNIHTAASYAACGHPAFSVEGAYALQARSETWDKCYKVMGEALAGRREVPRLDELLAELPPLEWPEAPAQ